MFIRRHYGRNQPIASVLLVFLQIFLLMNTNKIFKPYSFVMFTQHILSNVEKINRLVCSNLA